jgi:hypothetical protein
MNRTGKKKQRIDILHELFYISVPIPFVVRSLRLETKMIVASVSVVTVVW